LLEEKTLRFMERKPMNYKLRSYRLLPLLMALALLLGSCAAPTEAPPTSPPPTEAPAVSAPATEATMPEAPAATPTEEGLQPKTGGTLVVAISGEPPHLMGLNQNRVTQYVSTQLFPALLEYDFNVNPVPSLAESWEISDDGLTYTFHLVKGATWTDGQPITSEDVKFSIEDMAINYHPSGKANFGSIEAIDTPDASTVVVKLKQPYAPLIKLFSAMNALVLPKHIYEGTDPFENPNSLDGKVTGGPFVLEEWVKGDHITLKRNESFFKPGRPYLDRVIFRFIPDSSARVVALQAGEVDYIASGSFSYDGIEALAGAEGITTVGSGAEATADVATFGFNLRKKPFDDVKVRQAMNYAIDRSFILQAVTFGKGMPAIGPLHPSSWAFDADVLGPFDYPYDPQKAEELLDEAGYPRGADGWRFTVTLNTRPALFVYAKTNEIMADNLRAVGIDAKLNALETAAYYPAMYENWDFDISGGLFISGYSPQNLASIYTCDQILRLQFTNFMGYCNHDVDAMFQQAVATLDQAERKSIYLDIQKQILQDAPAIWAFGNVDWVAYRDTFHGLPPGPWNGRDPMDGVWTENP
jgi:peptide/nickel transport system substrate-binding protein